MATLYTPKNSGYLSPDDLEFAAIGLLSSFERKEGIILKPPVPLDQIVERHMGLTMQFCRLDPQLLGYLSVMEKIITINESLGDGSLQSEGRYNFTVAHEAAHEILHAPDLRRKAVMGDLFGGGGDSVPTILCRKDNQNEFIEYQANSTGAAIVMPKKLMHQFWRDRFGDLRQLDEDSLLHKLQLNADFYDDVERMRGGGSEAMLEEHFRPTAKEFAVSPQAFCRRLRTLGLLGSQNNRELFARTGA